VILFKLLFLYNVEYCRILLGSENTQGSENIFFVTWELGDCDRINSTKYKIMQFEYVFTAAYLDRREERITL